MATRKSVKFSKENSKINKNLYGELVAPFNIPQQVEKNRQELILVESDLEYIDARVQVNETEIENIKWELINEYGVDDTENGYIQFNVNHLKNYNYNKFKVKIQYKDNSNSLQLTDYYIFEGEFNREDILKNIDNLNIIVKSIGNVYQYNTQDHPNVFIYNFNIIIDNKNDNKDLYLKLNVNALQTFYTMSPPIFKLINGILDLPDDILIVKIYGKEKNYVNGK